jgi:Leucine-rich repeat (LRR) protein
VVFPDSELASCIAEQAEANGWTYVSDVTQVICQRKAIASLEGMQAFAEASPGALTLLDFIGCDITDLEPLRRLTGLETLELGGGLSGNKVTDLEPLAGLKNLITLNIRGQLMSDLSPLAGLARLESLDLEDNLIDDIRPLASLAGLQRLNLRVNNIEDLRPLSDLQALRILNLVDNAFEDLTPLFQLASLQELVLGQDPRIPCDQLDELKAALPETRVLSECGG